MEALILESKDLLTKIASAASYFSGTNVKPFESISQLEALSPDQLNNLIKQLEVYGSIYDGIKDKAYDKKAQDREFLERIMSHFKLKPKGDISEYIDGKTIVELYDTKGVQLYRNLVFLEYCSYDLVTLYTVPHTELYERNGYAVDQFMKFLQGAFHAEGAVPFHMDAHLIKETYLNNRKRFNLKFGIACPLTDENENVTALLTTNTCTEFELKVASG